MKVDLPSTFFAAALLMVPAVACSRAASESSPSSKTWQPAATSSAATNAGGGRLGAATDGKATRMSPSATAAPPEVKATPDDPQKGVFTLAEATKGLAGSGPIEAELDTSRGKLVCKLYEDKAPLTVANFVGLARGLRAWKDADGKWTKKPLYDKTVFHRVIDRFMIQGGDPAGNGSGGPGYEFADEIWEGARHDRAGLLCMANRGPNTNGSQFFITDSPTPHLDELGHTIFGECAPTAIVHDIATVAKDGRDKPLTPVVLRRVTVRRGMAK